MSTSRWYFQWTLCPFSVMRTSHVFWRRRRRLIWKLIRQLRPFSNYTQIIVIACERSTAFISLFFFPRTDPSAMWLPRSSPLTLFTSLSIKFSPKYHFIRTQLFSLHLGLLVSACECLLLPVFYVCVALCVCTVLIYRGHRDDV